MSGLKNKAQTKTTDKNKNKSKACIFYLNGCCTNENCPYAHVTRKQCSYVEKYGNCSKGDRCTYSHECVQGSECKTLDCKWNHPLQQAELLDHSNYSITCCNCGCPNLVKKENTEIKEDEEIDKMIKECFTEIDVPVSHDMSEEIFGHIPICRYSGLLRSLTLPHKLALSIY